MGISSKLIKVLLFMIFLVIIGVGSFLGYKLYLTKSSAYDPNTRQAVFLISGQVYFGNIENPGAQVVTLRNIYYLKTLDSDAAGDFIINNSDKSKVQLIKFGSEVHGPEDIMHINRDQILFYENMKKDSKISQMIQQMGG